MLLIILVGLIAYANSFAAPFVYDDSYFILDPRMRKYFWPLWRAFIPPAHFQPVIHRPLVTLSIALNHALGGTDVWGYHAFNLAVHLLAALTLFAVLRRSFEGRRLKSRTGAASRPLALTIALLWVAHPVQTESVMFIYQRAEALMGLFILLTLYGVIRSAEQPGRRRWKLFTAAACALGMMGNQGMLTAPPLALVYDRIFLSGSFAQTFKLRGRLYLVLALTSAIPFFFFAIGHHENSSNFGWFIKAFTPLQYALNQPRVILHYLRLAFWPHPLMLDYAWVLTTRLRALAPSLLAVGGLLAATAWGLRRRPEAGFLGFAFFLLLSPVCSFISIADPGAEHRLYLALAPVLTLAVVGLYEAFPWRKETACLFVTCAVAALAVATHLRNRDYRSAVSIWSDNVAKRPSSFIARSNLGAAYTRDGKYPQALEQLEKALELRPDAPEALCNMGVALAALGRRKEATACIKAALEINPRDAHLHSTLGVIDLRNGDPAAAEKELERSLHLEPDIPGTENNLGIALTEQKRQEEALVHFERAIRLQPDDAKAQHNLGITLARLGRLREAVKALQRAYRLDQKLSEDDRKLVHNTGFQPGILAIQ